MYYEVKMGKSTSQTAEDDILMYFYLFFSEKTRCAISFEIIHMKCPALLLPEKKKFLECHLQELCMAL